MPSAARDRVDGALIAESLRLGIWLDGLGLVVDRITRIRPTIATSDQPTIWTMIDFSVRSGDVDKLAHALERALAVDPPWCADFRTESETFVIFPGRSFRYPRADGDARKEAFRYGLSLGIPDLQLDWPK